MTSVTIDPSAHVHERAKFGNGCRVWHLAQVREDAELGDGCSIGRGAYVGPEVLLGRNVKLQNYALVYGPAVLEDGVFVGPAVVLTNDKNPRAVDPDGSLKSGDDWEPAAVHVGEGSSLGARTVVVAPCRIGRWALVGAGAVVVGDVPDFALMVGSPARRVGWVGRAGVRLLPVEGPETGHWRCPETGETYTEVAGVLEEDPA